MKNIYFKIAALCLLTWALFLRPASAFAQDTPTLTPDSSVKKKEFKNTVRFNLTNPLFFGFNAIILGYERTLGKNRSISINIGQNSLPELGLLDNVFNNSIVQSQKTTSDKSYNISADYRFYLREENRHNAPRGVYVAPYMAYNFFERENTWTLNSNAFQGDVNTDFKITMASAGVELGYQFIFWKRVALDFILIGPGLTRYELSTTLSTTLSADDQAELFKKINDALASKIPGYSLVIDDLEYEKTGSVNTTTFGFRYMIHVGFRF